MNEFDMRDKNLDIYRGGVMLYIILVIHGLTNFQFVSAFSWVTSILLFEMPIILFISGAALKLSKRKKFKEILKSRFYRILIPYYIYAFITILFAVLVIGKQDFWELRHIVFIKNSPLIPYSNQIWFIIPYFIISILGNIYLNLYEKSRSKLHLLILAFVCIIVIMDYFSFHLEQLREVIVYSIFFIFGFYYKEHVSNKILLTGGVCSLIMVFFLFTLGYPLAIQNNKFPPNLLFIFFGAFYIFLFSLIFRRIQLPNWKVLQRWNKYGLEIYLYQNYAFLLVYVVLLFLGVQNVIFQYIVTLVLLFGILTISSPYINKLNGRIIQKMKLVTN